MCVLCVCMCVYYVCVYVCIISLHVCVYMCVLLAYMISYQRLVSSTAAVFRLESSGDRQFLSLRSREAQFKKKKKKKKKKEGRLQSLLGGVCYLYRTMLKS